MDIMRLTMRESVIGIRTHGNEYIFTGIFTNDLGFCAIVSSLGDILSANQVCIFMVDLISRRKFDIIFKCVQV